MVFCLFFTNPHFSMYSFSVFTDYLGTADIHFKQLEQMRFEELCLNPPDASAAVEWLRAGAVVSAAGWDPWRTRLGREPSRAKQGGALPQAGARRLGPGVAL